MRGGKCQNLKTSKQQDKQKQQWSETESGNARNGNINNSFE